MHHSRPLQGVHTRGGGQSRCVPWPAEVHLGLTELRALGTQDPDGNMLVPSTERKTSGPPGQALGEGLLPGLPFAQSHRPEGSRQVRVLSPSRDEHHPRGQICPHSHG